MSEQGHCPSPLWCASPQRLNDGCILRGSVKQLLFEGPDLAAVMSQPGLCNGPSSLSSFGRVAVQDCFCSWSEEATHFASRLQKSVPYGFMVHGASSLFGASEHDGLQSWSLSLRNRGQKWRTISSPVCGVAEAVRCRRLGTKSRNPYWR